MKILAVMLLLLCGGCMNFATDSALPVQFRELIQNPERFAGKTVRLRCVVSLFGERTMFTASGVPPSFDCDAIYLKSQGTWERTARYATMSIQARRVFERFRGEHPDLAWPEVEAEVELVARFDLPDRRVARYTFTPIDLLDFRLIRVIAISEGAPHPSLRSFSIDGREEEQNHHLR